MAASLPKADARTLANGLRARTTQLRTLAKNGEIAPETRKSGALVRDVMHRVGLSQKAFAINCGQRESVVSEALNGQRHLAVEWLDAQDDVFVTAYAQAWLDSRALTPQNQRAARLKLAATLFQQLVDLVEEA